MSRLLALLALLVVSPNVASAEASAGDGLVCNPVCSDRSRDVDAVLRATVSLRAAAGLQLQDPTAIADLQLGGTVGAAFRGGAFLGLSLDVVVTSFGEPGNTVGGHAAVRFDQVLGGWEIDGGQRHRTGGIGLEAGVRAVGGTVQGSRRPFEGVVVLDFAVLAVFTTGDVPGCLGLCVHADEPLEVGVRLLVLEDDQALLLTFGNSLAIAPGPAAPDHHEPEPASDDAT